MRCSCHSFIIAHAVPDGYEESITTLFTYRESETLMGDVNLNGVVDITDATIVQLSIAGLFVLSEAALAGADVNKDGVVDIGDAMVYSILSDTEPIFCPEESDEAYG